MNQNQVFEWNGATFTVKPSTIRDEIQKETIAWKLSEAGINANDDPLLLMRFLNCITQTEITGAIGYEPPAATDTPADLRASFEAWCNLPGDLYRDWRDAVQAANADPVAPELTPEVDADTLKKDQTS